MEERGGVEWGEAESVSGEAETVQSKAVVFCGQREGGSGLLLIKLAPQSKVFSLSLPQGGGGTKWPSILSFPPDILARCCRCRCCSRCPRSGTVNVVE